MKTRYSLVSNSSSSSFIFPCNIELTQDLMELIANCTFCITVTVSKDKREECYQDLLTACASKDRQSQPLADVGVIDDDKIDISNYRGWTTVNSIFKVIQDYEALIGVYTGGTSSEVLPQAMLQSYFIDKSIAYEVMGDGSFNLRNPDEIEELLKEYDYPGPAGALLKYYHGQCAGDENPSE